MKIFKKALVLILSLACAASALGGCSLLSSDDSDDPVSAIQSAYGNTQFTITFSSEGLSEPLDDMYYTSYSMPTLPTPTRVGYVFEGWYMDSAYTTQYFDGILYLYMSDVTLYGKWSEEVLSANGIYEIKTDISIVEDSVTFTDKAVNAKYGGYSDFLDDIVYDEIQIEYANGKALLKFQWDNRTTETFNSAETYSVSVSSLMGGNIYLADQVASLSDTLRTYYFNISGISLSDTIYLTVVAYNWDAELEGDDTVELTKSRFTLAIQITDFIGFSQGYADVSNDLEEGVYLVKTHYEKYSGGGSSDLESYNPVYSYIQAYEDDGVMNYRLIKPMTPYVGFAGTGAKEELLALYSDRSTVTTPFLVCYDKYEDGAYGGYNNVDIEFHADSGTYYYVIDLGTSFKKSLIIDTTASGLLEFFLQFGSVKIEMTIDYDYMVEVESSDYEPLTGDAYEYETQFAYAYSSGDLADTAYYENMQEYGLTVSYVNFFYSATSADADDKTMYSSKISVTPLQSGDADDYSSTLAYFTVNSYVYGYDSTAGALYSDAATRQYFGDYSLREYKQTAAGKTLSVGDEVNLAELYAEKVNSSVSFSSVSYAAYKITNGEIDTSTPVSVGKTFTFTRDIAVVFTRSDESGTYTTAVELTEYTDPVITFKSNGGTTYDAGEEYFYYDYNDIVAFPDFTWYWCGFTGSFVEDYYLTGEDVIINPVYTKAFEVDDSGNYTEITLTTSSTGAGVYFSMSADYISIFYQLTNKYGEFYLFEVKFAVSGINYYNLYVEGETKNAIATDRVTYSSGVRKNIQVAETYTDLLTSTDVIESALESYYVLVVDGEGEYTLNLTSAIVKTESGINTFTDDFYNQTMAKLATCEYAYVELKWSCGKDYYVHQYTYNMLVNGLDYVCLLSETDLFTDTVYSIQKKQIVSTSGTLICTASISGLGNNVKLKNLGGGYSIEFLQAGTYNISITIGGMYRADGSYRWGEYDDVGTTVTMRFYQTVTVIDISEQGSITYDLSYCSYSFKESLTMESTYTVTFNLTDTISLLTTSSFDIPSESLATLYAWTTNPSYTYKNTSYLHYPTAAITDYISEFNTQHVTLYPVFDERVTVTMGTILVDAGGETQTEDEYTKTYALSTTTHYSYYKVTLYTDFLTYAENNTPSGYTLAGFKGEMFGNNDINKLSSSDYKMYSDTVIYAVYKKVHTVKYTVNNSYSNSALGTETVTDGDCAVKYLTNTVAGKNGYTFVGWIVSGSTVSSVSDLIDLSAYPIYENVTFAAVFTDSEGKFVW